MSPTPLRDAAVNPQPGDRFSDGHGTLLPPGATATGHSRLDPTDLAERRELIAYLSAIPRGLRAPSESAQLNRLLGVTSWNDPRRR
jgi:hypothetical protein